MVGLLMVSAVAILRGLLKALCDYSGDRSDDMDGAVAEEAMAAMVVVPEAGEAAKVSRALAAAVV